MSTPVRDGIELDAVGELHLVLGFQPLSLPSSSFVVELLPMLSVFAQLDLTVVSEFVVVLVLSLVVN